MNTDNEIQNLVEKLNKVEGFLSGMTMVAMLKDQTETIRHVNDMRMEVVHLKDGMLKIYWELKDLRITVKK